MTKPWKSLPKSFRDVVLYGSGDDEITFTYDDGVRHYSTTKPFEGVITNIERRWRETESAWMREELSRFQSDHPCEVCGGYRLKPQALAVKVAGRISAKSRTCRSGRPRAGSASCPPSSRPKQNEIAARILEGDPRAAQFPQRCRPRLSHAVARMRLALGRRKPAHPARLADRLRADRRPLCARRALDRACISATMRGCSTR